MHGEMGSMEEAMEAVASMAMADVLDEAVLGSIAYGVLELGVPLIVVLGHQGCGAVAAAVHAEAGGELPAHIAYLADRIRPAIDHSLQGEARIDAAVTENVRRAPGTPCRRAGPRCPGHRRLPGRSRRPLRADQPVGA